MNTNMNFYESGGSEKPFPASLLLCSFCYFPGLSFHPDFESVYQIFVMDACMMLKKIIIFKVSVKTKIYMALIIGDCF